MTDKELEQKLRWIFETYGKDLQAFFRDAYAEGLNIRPALPKFTQYCSKCGEGHNKAVSYCLKPDCGGMMGERRHALRAALKLKTIMFKGVPIEFDHGMNSGTNEALAEFDNLRTVCEDDNVQ